MKKILANYRYYVLAALVAIAMIGILSEPSECLSAKDWFCILISSKVIGFSALYIMAKLVRRWERKGTIPELTKTADKDF